METSFDRIVMTNDYLGHIIALFFARSGASTCLIEDQRIKNVPFVFRNLSLIDREYLRLMGVELGIKPLIEIDHYLQDRDRQIISSGNVFKLGSSPFDNTLEILRKWAYDPEIYQELISLEKRRFDPLFENYAEMIAKHCYFYENFQTLSKEIFFVGEETSFKNILFKLQSQISHYLKNYPKLLDHLAQTFFGNVKRHYNEFELFYIVYNLLSPSYHLNEEKLNEHLKFSLLEREGEHSDKRVDTVNFKHKGLKKLTLGAKEVPFKKMIFHGERLLSGPIGIYRKHNLYRAYLFKGKVSGPRFDTVLRTALIVSDNQDYLWGYIDETGATQMIFHAEEFVGGCKQELFKMAKERCLSLFSKYGLLDNEMNLEIEEQAEFYGYLSRSSERNHIAKVENRDTGDPIRAHFEAASYFQRSPSGLFKYLNEVKSYYFRE